MALTPSARLLQCWGKTSSESPEIYHPAVYHMLDVGNVARVFLGNEVSQRWKNILGRALNCENGSLAGWLPWAVAIHDIGKISSTFQAQSEIQAVRLRQLGFSIFSIPDLNHPVIGQAFFKSLNDEQVDSSLQLFLPDVIGGHHGHFSSSGAIREVMRRLRRDEAQEWQELRFETKSILDSVFLSDPFCLAKDFNVSTAIMALTGFTILCDWIGSNSAFFPADFKTPFEEYLRISEDRARAAVQMAGFMQKSRSDAPTVFSNLFGNIANPRPLQTAVDRIPDVVLAQPCLVVIEAPTGEGKTETALAIAHRIASLQGSDEFYYALPTTATSNQMYSRVEDYLQEQLRLKTGVRLVHSQAFLMQDSLVLSPMLNGEKDRDFGYSLEWFSSKKRALLAPFGVGTVDQAELGALNVAHNSLRLVGLAGKVLILDEVHAYDTYMSTILSRLLKWLSALGTSVILLSATLPRSRRELLTKSFGATLPEDQAVLGNYPMIFAANHDFTYVDSPPAVQPDRKIAISQLHLTGDHPEAKAQWLLDQLGEEGCWCWITNTVQRAQDIFKSVDDLAPADVKRILIHSRFPLATRDQIELQLKEYFGPTGKRPEKAVVIGTQVLEQSLDLDFDGMVTDIAPVDLLLQRAGRLHRHLWRDATTRGIHQIPHLYIYQHRKQDGSPNLNSDKVIYAEYFLRKTSNELEKHDALYLPADYRSLIAAVYDSPPPDPADELYSAWKDLKKSESLDNQEAQIRLLPPPDPQEAFHLGIADLTFKEDEDRAGWIVARTRLGEESLTIIPMEEYGAQVKCYGLNEILAPDQPVDMHYQLRMLRNSIKISGDELCAAIRNAANPKPPLFEKSPHLRNVYPLWVKGGQASLLSNGKTFHLTLDSRLGLLIDRQKGSEHD